MRVGGDVVAGGLDVLDQEGHGVHTEAVEAEREDVGIVSIFEVGAQAGNRRLGIRAGEGMSGQVLASRQPLLVRDLSAIHVVNPVLRDSGLRSVVAVPLLGRGAPLGVPRHRATKTLSVFRPRRGGLPLLAGLAPSDAVAMVDSFYRSGALVFGGGHVILPLLEAELKAGDTLLIKGPPGIGLASADPRFDAAGTFVGSSSVYATALDYLRNVIRHLSRATLMENVWGIRLDPGTNVVDVFINSRRNKLDPERDLIQTLRGVGYLVKVPEREE